MGDVLDQQVTLLDVNTVSHYSVQPDAGIDIDLKTGWHLLLISWWWT